MNDQQKLALFNLALAFTAPKNEVRHYLQAVHVQSGALYGCDGHRCVRIMATTNDSFGEKDISYTAESVRNCVKVKRLDLLEELNCTRPPFDTLCKLPSPIKTGIASFNPKLLADSLGALAKYSKKPVEVTIFDSTLEGARLSVRDDIAIIDAIVMPLMGDYKGGK